jgi:periplasmic copper chaperone A
MSIAPLTAGVLRRRTAMAATLGLITALASVVVVATAASAHVEVKPAEVEGGEFAEIAFSVPNERADASTVKFVVALPSDQPLASVQTSPVPGWQITTKNRKLAEPIELEGAPVSKVVSQITWKATGDGISPGEFQDFPVSLGVLPTSGKLTFKAVQTYSDGDVVRWDEIAAAGPEPEHPAPVLALTAPEDSSGETTVPPSVEPTTAPASTPPTAGTSNAAESEGDDDGSSDWLPIALSIAALVVAIGALGLTLRRGRS